MTVLWIAIVVTGLIAVARIVRHKRQNARMHRFVDRVMAPRIDQQADG